MRKGTLTDHQTLMLYNKGESIITLAIHEGMSVFGCSARLTRARKTYGMVGTHRSPSKLAPIANVDTLAVQLRALERAVRKMKGALR